jgi:hypothetical protein
MKRTVDVQVVVFRDGTTFPSLSDEETRRAVRAWNNVAAADGTITRHATAGTMGGVVLVQLTHEDYDARFKETRTALTPFNREYRRLVLDDCQRESARSDEA